MVFVWIILILALLISASYLLMLKGRKNHPDMAALRGWNYAHRGLHDEKRPENSMVAFRAALEKGYGIELDVHLLADGTLAVFHDHSLLRMTGKEGEIETLTREQLSDYCLGSTLQTIPVLEDVLALFAGKAPLIVELKAVGGNHAALTDRVVALLQDYSGPYCIESFDPRCIYHLKKHYPQIIRGQLSQNFLHIQKNVPWIARFCLTKHLFNFLLKPDFVSYCFRDREILSNRIVRKLWKVQGVAWTLRTPQEHQIAVQEGWMPIFENYEP